MKMIVAFSSIIHIALPARVLLLNSNTSSYTSIFILIGHGVTSPFMFYLIPKFYNFTSSRNILINNSLLSISPLLVLIWGVCTLLNLPAPPFISFIGEVFIFYNLFVYRPLSLLCIVWIVSYSVIICCYLYSSLIHAHPLFNTPRPSLSPLDLGLSFIPLCLTLLLLGGLGFSLFL